MDLMAADWFFTGIHAEFCVFFHVYQTTYCPVISIVEIVVVMVSIVLWVAFCLSCGDWKSGIFHSWSVWAFLAIVVGFVCCGFIVVLGCYLPMICFVLFSLFMVVSVEDCYEYLSSVQLCFSPVKAWIAVWLLACSVFFLGLHWSGEWGPEVLDKPGGLRTTQT